MRPIFATIVILLIAASCSYDDSSEASSSHPLADIATEAEVGEMLALAQQHHALTQAEADSLVLQCMDLVGFFDSEVRSGCESVVWEIDTYCLTKGFKLEALDKWASTGLEIRELTGCKA